MTRVTVGTPHNKNNVPVVAIGTLLILIGYAVVLAVTGHMSDEIVGGLIITTVPSVAAAAFSERAARDIRNGVVQEKAKAGVHEALAETGVTDIVNQAQETQPQVLTALANLGAANAKLLDSLDKHNGKDTPK